MKAIYNNGHLLCLATITLAVLAASSCLDNERRSENQAECAGQRFGELMPYPGNCTRFLVCDCEYPTVKYCPGGTWFSNKTVNNKGCTWPQDSDCKPGGGTPIQTPTQTPASTPSWTTVVTPRTDIPCLPYAGVSSSLCLSYEDGTLFPYPLDCHYYVNCTNHCPILNLCATDKVFNALLKICDTPDTAHCEASTLPMTTPGYSTVPHTPTREAEPSTPPPAPSCQPQNGVPGDFCKHEENGSFHYYKYNCSAYIACSSGCPEVSYCSPGMYFNPDMGICDFPDAVVCDESPFPTTTSPATTVEPTPPPEINDSSCSGLPSHTLLPYPEDCAKYAECLDGQVHIRTCPQGSLFNAALLICDEPEDVICWGDGEDTTISTLPIVTTTQLPDSTTSPSTVTTNSPTTSTPVYSLCVGQSNGTTFSYTEDCQLYYYCWGNDTSTILPCPYNNWYNPKTGDCGPDVLTNACRDTIEAVCAYEPVGKALPISTNCAQYTLCMGDGDFLTLNCPRNNFFNPVTGNCGPDVSPTACRNNNESTTTVATVTTVTKTSTTSQATTTPGPAAVHGICGQYSNGEMVSYPNNCNKYIVCSYPVPIAHLCPNNWHFNESKQKCDLPENSNCEEQKPEPGIPESTTTTWTTLPSNTNPTMTTPKPLEICAGVTEGILVPYPGNCEKYIICELPIPTASKCQPGMEFNAERQLCMMPENANCSIKTSTTEITTTEETKTSTEQTTTKETTSVITTSAPLTCADVPNYSTFPYPPDCTKYIICINGAEVTAPCTPGTYYNKVAGECDRQTSPNACREDTTVTQTASTPIIPPTTIPSTPPTTIPNTTPTTIPSTPPTTIPSTPPTTIPSTPPTTIPSTPPTTPGCNTSPDTTLTPSLPPINDGICYGKADGTLVPYPNECDKYIKCASPIPIGNYCPDHLQFSAELLECVEPELANCGTGSITTPITPITTPKPYTQNVCCGQNFNVRIPYPDDPSKYIICKYPIPEAVDCPKGMTFNESMLKCTIVPEGV